MAYGAARHVSPQRRAASPVTSMLKIMKQAKAAFSLLSADEIVKQSELPVHFGLVVDGSNAYAEMEEFLAPATLPRQEWRERMSQVHRANDADVPSNVKCCCYLELCILVFLSVLSCKKSPTTATAPIVITPPPPPADTIANTPIIPPIIYSGYSLLWNDEFNDAGIDGSKWNFETGTGVNGDFGTGQLDRATDRPENAKIQNG